MTTKKAICLLILMCSYALGQGSPIEDYQFERLTPNQGLSQSQVTALLQDRHGFMWLGTRSGLNQYDGYEFTVYKHDPSNPQSLSNNHISALYETRDGNIWVGTAMGLNRLNPRDGVFEHWYKDPDNPNGLTNDFIRALQEDWEGKLWIGTWGGGLISFDRDTGVFKSFTVPPIEEGKVNHDYILSLYLDSKGILWIGTWGDGMSSLNPSSGELKSWRNDPEDLSSLAGNNVSAFLEDGSGAFWVGGWNSGLMLMDRKEGRFQRWIHDETNPQSLGGNIVRSIKEGVGGRLWLGLWGQGIDLFDGNSKFRHLVHNETNPSTLGSDWVQDLYMDDAGILWVATDGMGVAKADTWSAKIRRFWHNPRDVNSLSHPSVSSIAEDEKGLIWIGTSAGGLNRYDVKTNKFTHFRSGGDGEYNHDDFVRFVVWDVAGRGLWLATDSGVSLFNPENNTWLRWQRERETRRNFPQTIYQESSSRLWIGLTGGGLLLMDDTGQILEEHENDPLNPKTLSENHVRCIVPRVGGGLWVGTYGGGLNFSTPTAVNSPGIAEKIRIFAVPIPKESNASIPIQWKTTFSGWAPWAVACIDSIIRPRPIRSFLSTIAIYPPMKYMAYLEMSLAGCGFPPIGGYVVSTQVPMNFATSTWVTACRAWNSIPAPGSKHQTVICILGALTA